MLTEALTIAAKAHKNQLEKNGNPYIMHPLRVVAKMTTQEEMCVALLHDVVEDTEVTLDELKAVFPSIVTDAVALITKADGIPYEQYLHELCQNPIARKVKLADMEDNMDIRRLPDIEDVDVERLKKYKKCYALIKDNQI